jgi:hypothetical protein
VTVAEVVPQDEARGASFPEPARPTIVHVAHPRIPGWCGQLAQNRRWREFNLTHTNTSGTVPAAPGSTATIPGTDSGRRGGDGSPMIVTVCNE